MWDEDFNPELPSTSTFLPIPSGGQKIFSREWYLQQRRESANVVDLIANRRLGGRRPRTPQCKLNRDIYTAVPLIRGSVVAEMISRDHIVTWTPDGTRLICYSAHLDVVRVYFYRGVQSSRNVPEEQVLMSLFELDFEVKPNVSDGFQLRLDSLYFTGTGRFFVVGASAQIAEANVQFDLAYVNNESIPMAPGNLEDLNLICIDLETKQMVGEKYFHMDKIPLAGCVNVSGNYLMVTSLQHQVVYIIQIHPQTGQMFSLKEIGPSVRDDDLLQLASQDSHNLTTTFYTGFRQQIMTFLYKRAKTTGTVRAFLRSTEYLNSLRMDRAYLFEEFYIMIRMLPKDSNKETSANPCFFVIMDWRDAKIIDLFEDYDERFLSWTLEMSFPLLYPVTTPAWVGASNFSYHAQWAMLKGIRKGEQRHCAESLRRLLNQMPFPSYQPYKISTQSPYLDPFLFQLDAKLATGIINGKLRADQDDPRFIVVRTGKASFQLSLSVVGNIGLRQVTLLFHPQDPLALAVDRIRQDPSVVVFQPRIEIDPVEPSTKSGLPFLCEVGHRMRPTAQLPLRELHLALVGMTGSGKSALAVKYITKRFIGDYDSLLEDTYCRADNVSGQSLMVWVMDTVDDATRDEMRWLAWADIFVVVYDVTSQLSLQYAENVLERIARHEHLLCAREHKTILLGNKSDLERYRQVAESDGEALATKYKASFAEVAATADHRVLSQILHSCFHKILNGTRSPSPRLCASDSEIVTPRKASGFSLRSSSRSSQMRSKPAPPKPSALHKTPSLSKIKTGSKLLKLFHA